MTNSLWTIALFSVLCLCRSTANKVTVDPDGRVHMEEAEATSHSAPVYGADISWPMQHGPVGPGNKNPLGDDRRRAYMQYMDRCREQSRECEASEEERIHMNLVQPTIMQNYTHAGYAKVSTPKIAQDLLEQVWEEYQDKQLTEEWAPGEVYVNHWDSPTQILNLYRPDLGLEEEHRWQLIKAVQSVLEAWTKQSLVLTSMYGIRVYGDGSILAPHVDRLPLVSSVIINVAQDVEDPWILEVIGHDGKAHNLTMETGDMILYESHSVIHGRPYPLKGKYYANLFVHFEPLGHTLRHEQSDTNGVDGDAKEVYEQALKQQHQNTDDQDYPVSPNIPPYVNAEKVVQWKQQYDYEKEEQISPKPTKATLGRINPHYAAADGMLSVLKSMAEKDRSQLFNADQNGWRPLHEAARGGQYKVVEYLLEEGAQINERTNQGYGGNALYWAEKKTEKNRKAIEILKKYGAVSLGPESLKKKKK